MNNFTLTRWVWVCLAWLVCLVPAQAQRVAVNSGYTAAIFPNGTLWAWGNGGSGQLGTGYYGSQPTPTQASIATSWQSISAGTGFTLAIRTDGTLWAWGRNDSGQLGLGTTTTQGTPTQVGSTTTWASISAGSSHTLAIRTDGTLWAWGDNAGSQLGLGTSGATTNQLSPVQVGSDANWRSVSAGAGYTLAIRTDGTLWAWGGNNIGQLGLGTTTTQLSPVQVGTDANWRSVSAGRDHVLALRQDGTLWSWGSNDSGQLGNGTASNVVQVRPPLQVGTATTWRSVAAGNAHSLALRQDGTLYAWGDNRYGQLGNGTTTRQLTPTPAGGSATWQSIATGALASHSAGLRTDGTLYTWGRNANGELGAGFTQQLMPLQVGPPTTWQGLGAGSNSTFGLRPDGTLWTWGDNPNGQLGTDSNFEQPTPTQVGTATTWRQVSIGYWHMAAVRQDGTLWAWGDNQMGELGLGTTIFNLRTPVQVGTDTNWRSVSAGHFATFGIRTDGTLWAWGSNAYGRLGDGTTTNVLRRAPVQIGTATTWQSVSAGRYHTLALRQDGTLWAWGDNTSGQLGTGTASTTPQYSPVQVGTATDWQAVAAGVYYSLALRRDGTLWAWGDNTYGQLGTGTTTSLATPTQVGTATTWRRLAAGSYHAAALRQDGTLWTWGYNYYGQLGTGTTTNQLSPVQLGSATWQDVSAGLYHTVALQTNGTLWAWGNNTFGQTGQSNANPTPIYIPYPATTLAAAPTSTASTWTLAPNPAHGRVQLTGLPAAPLAMRLFDAQGRLVRTAASPTIGLEGLAPGLYLLRATTGPTTRTLRLVVE